MRTLLSRALFVIGFVACGSLSAQFQVNQVTPTAETTDASAVGDIVDAQCVDQPGTLTANSVMVWGRWSGVITGTRSLESGNTVIRFVPSEPFSAANRSLRRSPRLC